MLGWWLNGIFFSFSEIRNLPLLLVRHNLSSSIRTRSINRSECFVLCVQKLFVSNSKSNVWFIHFDRICRWEKKDENLQWVTIQQTYHIQYSLLMYRCTIFLKAMYFNILDTGRALVPYTHNQNRFWNVFMFWFGSRCVSGSLVSFHRLKKMDLFKLVTFEHFEKHKTVEIIPSGIGRVWEKKDRKHQSQMLTKWNPNQRKEDTMQYATFIAMRVRRIKA